MKIEVDVNDIIRRAQAIIGKLSMDLVVMTARAEQAEAKSVTLEKMLPAKQGQEAKVGHVD